MNDDLPWVEKYRPENFDTIISHNHIINVLTNLINNNHLPHIIFYGPPGTGKTTTILAAARKLYGSKYKSMILELNGSDDRGISVVREQIKDFSSTTSKISNIFQSHNSISDVKLIILDEADSMTFDAQFALRRVIELYTETTRFCLICNYLTKIIPALISRCMLFRFAPLKEQEHIDKINQVVLNEKINIDNDSIKQIISLSCGDMRKSLNVLQSLNMIYTDKTKIITLNDVNKLLGIMTENDKLNIIKMLFNNDNLKTKYNKINNLLKENIISINDVLNTISNFLICKTKLFDKTNDVNNVINIIIELGKIEIYLTNSSNNDILLLDILSIIELNKITLLI